MRVGKGLNFGPLIRPLFQRSREKAALRLPPVEPVPVKGDPVVPGGAAAPPLPVVLLTPPPGG
jgi:hypothetical protein